VPSFPDVDLEITAEAAFGADVKASPLTWVWTDLTDRLLPSLIKTSRGTAFGAQSRSTLSANGIELDNDDGWLTPYLASSPYHPYVDTGTPFRLCLRTTADVLLRDTFTRTTSGSMGTNDSGYTYASFGGGLPSISINGSVGQLATPAVNVVYRITANTFTARDVDYTYDIAMPAVSTGATVTAGGSFRWQTSGNFYWVTLEFLTSGSVNVQFRKTVGGVSTIVASAPSGLAYSGGQMFRTRVQAVGDRVRAKVWPALSAEPDLWLFEAYDTSFPAAGQVGVVFWINPGNTNALPHNITFDNLNVYQPRYERVEGYISDVRPVYIPTGDGDVYSKVMVDVGGVDVILERRDETELSPLRRSIEKTPNIAPVAYWPLEDEKSSTFAASAYADGPKLVVTGPVVFAAEDPPPYESGLKKYGTRPLASVAAGARLSGTIPLSGVNTEWAASIMAALYKPDVTGTEIRIMQWLTPGGTLNRWALVATNTSYIVRAYNDTTNTVTAVATYAGGVFDDLATFTVEANQNGANVDVGFFIDDFSVGTGSVAGTISAPSYVSINPDQVNTTASLTPAGLRFLVGHCRFVPETTQPDSPYYTPPETGNRVTAQRSWYQEPDHQRLRRLIADEEKVQFRYLGDPATTGYTLLGAQPEGNFKGLVERTVESSSGGMLFEAGFGYALLPRTTRYNRPADLVIDMATYGYRDDQDSQDAILSPRLPGRVPNSITVARSGGVEATYQADAAYRERKGTIGQRYELDVYSDDDPRQHAAWRVHVLNDAQGASYPDLPIDLAGTPSLIEDFLLVGIGSRIQRINQPTKAGLATIDQVADGLSEVFGPRTWKATAVSSPAEVWDTGIYDAADSTYDMTTTTVQTAFNTTDLSISVGGEVWVTGAVNLLLDIGGEHINVTSVAGSGTGPYTLTVPPGGRSKNGKVASHIVGETVKKAKPNTWGL
jgi:hypothetical protein